MVSGAHSAPAATDMHVVSICGSDVRPVCPPRGVIAGRVSGCDGAATISNRKDYRRMRIPKKALILPLVGMTLVALLAAGFVAYRSNVHAAPAQRYLVVYGNASQVDAKAASAHGHTVKADLSQIGALVVESSDPAGLASLPGVTDVVLDKHTMSLPNDETITNVGPDSGGGTPCASTTTSCGRQWDLARIHVPDAWQVTQGDPSVRIAVLDTGLDSHHPEVGANYDKADSRSFIGTELFGFCPADQTTNTSLEDFNGHGTWTATHVAGVDGKFMTGIAPNTTLLNIRVLDACGFGLDSWILEGMLYANAAGARVESMSLGGFLCANGMVPGAFYCGTSAANGDRALYKLYRRVVSYLQAHGTLVIAAAGNDHVQLGPQGEVQSHGTLADCVVGPNPCNDYTGLTEVPGGVQDVVAVGALNRVTHAGASGDTRYGQYGVGTGDQLTYYSNYGPRVDVSAPGGARYFNVPRFDCNTAECAALGPVHSSFDNTGDFGALGNCGGCYGYIQGTSMATPASGGRCGTNPGGPPKPDGGEPARAAEEVRHGLLQPERDAAGQRDGYLAADFQL
jgi:hypothetical protein